jgi:hypothetical protein
MVIMARPVSDKATFKVRLPKALIADIDEQHWTERRDEADIVRDALVDYLAAHAPKSSK